MIIEDFMKKSENIRLSSINRWMVFDSNCWIVYEHKHNAKQTQILIKTPNLDEALTILIVE
jgi:hypothetical protein